MQAFETFSEEQRKVIQASGAIQRVVAAAGSGKTRTVIGFVSNRLRERPGARVLMLSFSRKAVAELRSRLPEQAKVEVSTFHSFCYRHLARLDPRFRSKGPPGILQKARRVRFLCEELARLPEIGGIPYELLIENRGLCEELVPGLPALLDRRLARFKKSNGLVEFEDLIGRMVRGLAHGRPYLDRLRESYDLILVDEFQDTDPRQLEFLRLMRSPEMLVVGDDYQAIYGFRGATVEPFLKFPKHFPDTRTFQLRQNYRSLSPIVRAGLRVIRQSSKQIKKRVVAVRSEGDAPPVFSLALGPNQESELARDLKKTNVTVLVRTNARRRHWVRSGFPSTSVLTIHSAKGLEFPVVILDLLDGWSQCVPMDQRRSRRFRPPDEEVRVLYVGTSRARDLLIVVHGAREQETVEGLYFERTLAGICRPTSPGQLTRRLEPVFRDAA
ncbi:MAG: UvrD-helicase domain-containing protein [Spirochaetales bacterium]|nr:UvrD-helicase domain-containing protein [Leptospiraceae bacterium]MCP5483558.1 UvrD-helicase domain-containing protein [Spirochaetales bacterium]MCP5486412.1 UvrD-helicase domain-containing protein [Spirochaetales bacterium]